ncbi:50S ribosomal protein L23 [Treponema phagedenis]|uniref:Large ribosomal subunit protein uL23 n=1 Tax=Treponema phagedenis TaxID=162 RepID=A0A0B7GX70_TREPH|nr:50S ribosomal protein L23 [Treponema phagedenis]EFW36701.1 ribosomal protein L23 [Treponema phagedenis F0421]NVP24151.1 50S ribosomal protein L23 [Treponema phagedenis]QEJ96305.1 50S ribosomal protein L23 [Treponema phagedenis]QEJ99287.1 50S ribosomal protein L23 [Treponema phagedenis]QEK00082.1 50S ribosomal protein L23 [Treponema phagedenis]
MEHNDIIIAPVLTEKSSSLREEGKYVFRVDSRATKIQIKEAVAKLFNVKVEKCTVMNVEGKMRRVRYRAGKTSGWKKAIVKLAAGQSIKIFEGA